MKLTRNVYLTFKKKDNEYYHTVNSIVDVVLHKVSNLTCTRRHWTMANRITVIYSLFVCLFLKINDRRSHSLPILTQQFVTCVFIIMF